MKLKEIYYPTPLIEIQDIYNDNIDVIVKLENDQSFTLEVATPENLKFLMKKDHQPYISPGAPFAIVDKLTEENIGLLVQAFLEDPDYLRLYGCDIQDILNSSVNS